MPAVLVKAGEQKGGEPILRVEGFEALHTTNGAWGRRVWRSEAAQQRSKLEVHTERREPRVEWKMEEERQERRRTEGGGRVEGSRGVSEGVREGERRAGWGLRLPLLTAIDFL